MIRAAVAVGAAALTQFGGAATTSSAPAAPVYLRVLSATETTVKVAWGPTQPGPFAVTAATASAVTVRWRPSTDNGNTITYTVRRDTLQVATGYPTASRSFQVAAATSRFRVCVQGRDKKGRRSAWGCATVAKG